LGLLFSKEKKISFSNKREKNQRRFSFEKPLQEGWALLLQNENEMDKD
jgi:hypothetical protein